MAKEEKKEAPTEAKAKADKPKKEAKAKKDTKAKKAKDGVFAAADLRGKKADELKTLLLEAKKEQFNLRFQKKSGELTNLARISQVRRNIAKIKTVLTEQNKKDAA